MDGEDVHTLDGYFQMAILLYRKYFARISFCLTFWGISWQNILMKLLVAGCLRSKRQTTPYAPSSLALYGVDTLHVSALQKCTAMWLLLACRNTRISFFFENGGSSWQTQILSVGNKSSDNPFCHVFFHFWVEPAQPACLTFGFSLDTPLRSMY